MMQHWADYLDDLRLKREKPKGISSGLKEIDRLTACGPR